MTTSFSARTRVKMCGFTRVEDIQAAVQAGADALGFVFTKKVNAICLSLRRRN